MCSRCPSRYSPAEHGQDHGKVAVPLQPMEIHVGAQIHLQPMEELHPGAGGCPRESCHPWEACGERTPRPARGSLKHSTPCKTDPYLGATFPHGMGSHWNSWRTISCERNPLMKQGKDSPPSAKRETICDEKFFKRTCTVHPFSSQYPMLKMVQWLQSAKKSFYSRNIAIRNCVRSKQQGGQRWK